MRTRADLDGAFALLERRADAYAAAAEETVRSADPTTGDLLPLDPRRRAHHGRIRKATVILAAAAVTGGIAVGADQLAGPSSSPAHHVPAGVDESNTPAPVQSSTSQWTLPFALPASSGLSIVGVRGSWPGPGSSAAQPPSFNVTIINRATEFDLGLLPPGSGFGTLQVTRDMQRIGIDGKPGYYSAGKKALTFGSAGPDGVPPGGGKPQAVWAYAAGGYATLNVVSGSVNRAGLLAVARSLNFNGRAVMRSAISLSEPPPHSRLLYWQASYHSLVHQDPPWDLQRPSWKTELVYGTGTLPNDVAIEVASAGVRTSNGPMLDASTGQAINVGGYSGYWSAAKHQLTVDLGDGIRLNVREVVTFQGNELVMTLAQLSAIAADVTLVPNPGQPDTWFDANTALP